MHATLKMGTSLAALIHMFNVRCSTETFLLFQQFFLFFFVSICFPYLFFFFVGSRMFVIGLDVHLGLLPFNSFDLNALHYYIRMFSNMNFYFCTYCELNCRQINVHRSGTTKQKTKCWRKRKRKKETNHFCVVDVFRLHFRYFGCIYVHCKPLNNGMLYCVCLTWEIFVCCCCYFKTKSVSFGIAETKKEWKSKYFPVENIIILFLLPFAVVNNSNCFRPSNAFKCECSFAFFLFIWLTCTSCAYRWITIS